MITSPRRLVRRSLAALALAVVAFFCSAGVAIAHDQLVDSVPASGERLDDVPAEVRLTFSGELMDIGTTVVVADAAGQDWAASAPVLDGAALTVPLAPDLPDGAYTVRWRVVSADGHPVSGTVPFQVGDRSPSGMTASRGSEPAPAAATPSASSTSAPSTSAAPAPAAQATDVAERQTTSADPQAPGAEPASPLRTVLVAAVGAVIALGIYVVLHVTRRRARSRQP
ncbi:copper resistance protein CopC [Flavimobilis soli]|uniref:copper resistance protein CopC n=1 Tax=Flavimobilis soli TaxID=442709 RepID=UPI001475B85A|nr:copper resistance protein CopC [Flavimobilis soli]